MAILRHRGNRWLCGSSVRPRHDPEPETWTDQELKVVMRVGQHRVLFKECGDNWMVHRTDPTGEGLESLPSPIRPMLAVLRDDLPHDDERWGYEMKWDGVRAVVYV